MSDTQTAQQATEELLDVIAGLTVDQLARLAAAEGDYRDTVVVPAADSPGAFLLTKARDRYVGWVREHGGFPADAGVAVAEVTLRSQEHVFASVAAQAFVDLGLFYSEHAQRALDASANSLYQVVDAALEQLVIGLTKQYGALTGEPAAGR